MTGSAKGYFKGITVHVSHFGYHPDRPKQLIVQAPPHDVRGPARRFADGNDARIYPSVALVVAQYCRLAQTKPMGRLRLDLDTDGKLHTGDKKVPGDAFDQAVTFNEYSILNREVVYASLLLGPAEAALTFRDRDPGLLDRVTALCRLRHRRIQEIFQPRREWKYQLAGEGYSPPQEKYSVSARTCLNTLLFALKKEDPCAKLAVESAERLMALEQRTPPGDDPHQLSGWYLSHSASDANPSSEKAEKEVMLTPGICQS